MAPHISERDKMKKEFFACAIALSAGADLCYIPMNETIVLAIKAVHH
jgi:hypothetical protein